VYCHFLDSEVLLACTETWEQLKRRGCGKFRTFLFNKNNDQRGILYFPEKTVVYKDEEYLIVLLLVHDTIFGTSEDEEHYRSICNSLAKLGIDEEVGTKLLNKVDIKMNPSENI
jgi:hypothetical protein